MNERQSAETVAAILAAWRDAARHPFQKRTGYGDKSKRHDDCFRCRRPEGDDLHVYDGEQYTATNSDYIIIDLATDRGATALRLAQMAVKAALIDGSQRED